MRVIGYVRVSTQEQAENGYGLGAQLERIREECERRGWTLMSTFADEGASGKSLERPNLQSALAALPSYDGLVVAKLDRLTRSLADFSQLLNWFEDAGKSLIALDFDLDTTTPGGKLVAHIFGAVAEWERGVIGQRTREGLAAKKASGEQFGRPSLPSEVQERIIGLRESGLTLRAICQVLEDDGIPTARGGAWSPSSLQWVLGWRPSRRHRAAELPEIRRR